jgi:hypothetical protein
MVAPFDAAAFVAEMAVDEKWRLEREARSEGEVG